MERRDASALRSLDVNHHNNQGTRFMKIAFIGLGNMGAPMAVNLLKAGHEVGVFDLVDTAMKRLEAAGAMACASAQSAANGAEVIISMLPAGQHVRRLYLGRDDAPKQIGRASCRERV